MDNGHVECRAAARAADELEAAAPQPGADAVLTAAQRVALAREPQRPGVAEVVDALFEDFFEQRGDRLCADDPSIMGGIALFHGRPVTVLGNRKGSTVEDRVRFNFGMATPEGYRKAQRIMLDAEKFARPVLTFVDTPGAYPGLEAEARGQGEAIARTISVIMGEGGSGGALALAVGNRVLMLENAVYSVLSPEGFASILWKDASRADEACEVMKLTAADLLQMGVVDAVVPEPAGGAHQNPQALMQALDAVLTRELALFEKKGPTAVARERAERFRAMGSSAVRRGRV